MILIDNRCGHERDARASWGKSQTGHFNENAVIGSNSANKEIKITDFVKVWSEGSGNTIADIKSLKAI